MITQGKMNYGDFGDFGIGVIRHGHDDGPQGEYNMPTRQNSKIPTNNDFKDLRAI